MTRRRRDAAGFAFTVRGVTLVQVNRDYREAYDHLADNGLYRALIREGYMIGFRESGLKYAQTDAAYRVIRANEPPTLLTYPYEWPFGAWKAAALSVLHIAETALDHDMVLRRTSPDAMRFDGQRPLLTDPLAFAFYEEGRRWRGYSDFVRGWLGPLALMSLVDPSLGMLARAYPDGLPTATVSAMLPVRTRVNLGLTAHIHLAGQDFLTGRTDKPAIRETLTSLRETVEGLRYTPVAPAPRIDYTGSDHDEAADNHRRERVRVHLRDVSPSVVWDMAAGDGVFAEEAASVAGEVVAFAASPADAERLWARLVSAGVGGQVTPLVLDWANPSPNLGWAYRERRAVIGRASPDMLLALDWVYPLVLRAGLTFSDVAALCARLAPNLVVEFVPTTDPHVIALLDGDGAGDDYNLEAFEAAFRQRFEVLSAESIHYTDRTLYRLRRRET